MNKEKIFQNHQNYISNCYPTEMIDEMVAVRQPTNARRNTSNFSQPTNTNCACSLNGGCNGNFGGGNFGNPMQSLFGNQNIGGQNFNNQNFGNNQNFNGQNFQSSNGNFTNANASNFQNPFGGGNMMQSLMQLFSQNMPGANIMSLLGNFMPSMGMGGGGSAPLGNKNTKINEEDSSAPKIDTFKKIKNLD